MQCFTYEIHACFFPGRKIEMNTWNDRCAVMESDALSSQDAPLHHLCHTETAVMEKYTHLQYEDKSLLIQNSNRNQ